MWLTEVQRFLHASLIEPVEPVLPVASDAPVTLAVSRTASRRRLVVALTLVVGAILLGISLSLRPGDGRFYLLTGTLPVVWVLGAFASGPLHLGWAHTRDGDRRARPILQPIALGVLAVGVACLLVSVFSQVPSLREQINSVLDYARFGSLPLVALLTLVNGLAEEVFFRGALYAALPARHAVTASTALYALTTTTTGNPMLVLAAVVLGLLVGLQRRVTGGVLGPMLTHVMWSLSMLFLLPALIGAVT